MAGEFKGDKLNNESVRITEKMPDLSGLNERVTERMPTLSEQRECVTERMPVFSGLRERFTEKMLDLHETKEDENSNRIKQGTDSSERIEGFKTDIDDIMAGIITPGFVMHGERDDYIAVRPVGSGGTADVWSVKTNQGLEYAAKIYKEQTYQNRHIDEFFDEFQNQEIKGLVQLLDRGKIGKRNFYIIPLYDYKEILNVDFWRSNAAEDDIITCIAVLNEALHTIHQSGFFHRDIKPENILYDEKTKQPVLIDLGSVTRGVQDLGYMKSITENMMRTQGYTAPEIHEFHSGKDGKEVIATEKTDYFAFGVVIAEIFKKHHIMLEKTDELISNPLAYRLFENDGDIVEKTADDKIVYPRTLEENKRFMNLVEALLRHEKKYRAGYVEVNEWLKGKELEIDHNKYLGKQFEYQFRGQTCRSPEELAEAFAKNWEFAKKEIDRGTLKDTFPTFGQYKDYSDQFKDFFDYYGNLNIDGAIDFAVFETIRVLNPVLPFSWKGIIYQDEEGNMNSLRLAEAIMEDARKKGNVFDAFLEVEDISVNDDYSVYGEDFRRRLQILRMISKKSLERGKFCLAEFFCQGILVKSLSNGKYENVDEYLKHIVLELGEGSFDQMLDNIQRGINEHSNDVSDLFIQYQTTEVVHALFASAKQIDLPSKQNKEESIFVFRSLLELIGKDEKLKKQIIEAIKKSTAYKVTLWYLNNYHNYMFINAAKGTSVVNKLEKDFQEMKAKLMNNDIDVLVNSINVIIALGELLKQFNQYFIYENPLNESGLLCRPDHYTLNYIIPKGARYNLCLVNEWYWLPKAVCQELELNNVYISVTSLSARSDIVKDSVDVTHSMLGKFMNAFTKKYGSEKMEQIVSQKEYKINLKLRISIIGFVVSLLLILEGINCFKLWRQSSAGIDFACVIAGINLIVGALLSIVSLRKWGANQKEKRRFKENRKIYTHFLAIKNVLDEVNRMQKNDYKIRKLSIQEKDIIKDATRLGFDEYYKKHGLSKRGLFYLNPPVAKYFISIVVCVVLLCFNIFPARQLFLVTINGDIDSSYAVYLEHEKLFSFLRLVDKKISSPILRFNQKKLADSIIDLYNYGNCTDDEYNNKYEMLTKIYNGYGVNVRAEITDSLSNLIASKIAYEKGEKYISKGKKKKAIAQFVNVIREDSNYVAAQKYIDSYIFDLQLKQQEAFENNDKDALTEVAEGYRKLAEEYDEDSEIVNTYEILTSYDMEEAAIRLIAQQLYKNKKEWKNKDVSQLYSVKAGVEGKYYIKIGWQGHGLFDGMNYSEYVYLTYGVAEGESVPDNVDYYSDYVNSFSDDDKSYYELMHRLPFWVGRFDPNNDIEYYVRMLQHKRY